MNASAVLRALSKDDDGRISTPIASGPAWSTTSTSTPGYSTRSRDR